MERELLPLHISNGEISFRHTFSFEIQNIERDFLPSYISNGEISFRHTFSFEIQNMERDFLPLYILFEVISLLKYKIWKEISSHGKTSAGTISFKVHSL